jgi:hypothetical protein
VASFPVLSHFRKVPLSPNFGYLTIVRITTMQMALQGGIES